MNALEKLREQADLIAGASDGLKIVDAWALAHRLVGRFATDPKETARVFAEKDAPGLDALVRALEKPDEPAQCPEAPDDADAVVSRPEMDAAMRAFRKRLKLSRLSDESRLGGRYTSSGRKSGIDAIEPPNDFPAPVWKALVKAGRLVNTGQGFYALPIGAQKPG